MSKVAIEYINQVFYVKPYCDICGCGFDVVEVISIDDLLDVVKENIQILCSDCEIDNPSFPKGNKNE